MSQDNQAPFIEITNLVKKFGTFTALNGVSLNVLPGEVHALLGDNGAGKSTFINILGGLVKKNSGEVNVCGINIDKNIKLSKFKIGIVPQELNIDPFFSPAELLELQAGLYGVPKRKRKTDEILENLYEEALEYVTKKNKYQFDSNQKELEDAAAFIAKQWFEERCQ